MGYKVKWVEDNLGITRKALRNFEKKGLMPANKDGKYRDYSDEDISLIWKIRVLQGMGYSLQEIVDMKNSDDFDFDISISKKIEELESEIAEKERFLGFAKKIKLTGRFPAHPKEMGSMTFDEFHEDSLERWNINDDPEGKTFQAYADFILSIPECKQVKPDLDELKMMLDSLSESEFTDDASLQALNQLSKVLDEMMSLIKDNSGWEETMADSILPKAIVKRQHLGVENPEVQLLVKMIYESTLDSPNIDHKMTVQQFVRFESSSYLTGDFARLKRRELGRDGCEFIANAIAVFGGYTGYDEIED